MRKKERKERKERKKEKRGRVLNSRTNELE
jgi:hypothetical protein